MTIYGRSIPAIGALVAGLALAAPALAETTITAVMQAPLRTLDPEISTAQIVRTHGFMVFDTLLGMDAQYRPQPQMADYVVSDDKMTYTLTLRDGLKWHDGSQSRQTIASLR